jgi:hypothetical protein
MRINEEEGNPARLIVREAANENVVATVKNMPWPFRRRKFVAVQVCASDDINDDLLFAGESVDESVDYGKNFKAVPGSIRLFARLRSVSPNSCRLTAFQFFDAGGRVPVWVLNTKVVEALSGVEEIRKVFDRSDEIDKLARDEHAGVIELEQQVYDEEETAFVERVEDKFGGFKEENFKELDSPDHLVKMDSIFKAKDSSVFGRASTVSLPPPPLLRSRHTNSSCRSSTRLSPRWLHGRWPR